MKFSGENVAHVLKRGWGAYATTSPYDGVSVVEIDPDGMVRSLLPVGRGSFALAVEVGGRAHNLLFPYSHDKLCGHGLVSDGFWPGVGCDCGPAPIDRNPIRKA